MDSKRIDTVQVTRHEEIVIDAKALQTVNEGLARLLELINPNRSYFDSNYEQDFAELEAWIKAHIPIENTVEEIPECVIEGLLEVRESGRVNMFDQRSVIGLMHALGWDDGAVWLSDHKDRYMDTLNEMGKLVK